jgi:nucleoside-diphosphate-sugar epimerase
MRVLVAGAGGVMGQRVTPLLRRRGYEVAALTRSEDRRQILERMDLTVFTADALSTASVMQVFETFRPDTVVNQLTSIPEHIDLRQYDRQMECTNRLRTEGTDNLIAGAQRVGTRRFITQSFAGPSYAHVGDRAKSEEDPFDSTPPKQLRRSLDALRHLESVVTASFPQDGVILRYGWFYGPGTSIARNGAMAEAAKKRMLPIIAGGTGVWSFIHVDDAAAATVAAVDAPTGVYNIADDEPALVHDWICLLAKITRAKPPLEIPAWIARWLIGDHGVAIVRDNRGILNQKAKRIFDWTLKYPSWRDGFAAEFGADSMNSVTVAR